MFAVFLAIIVLPWTALVFGLACWLATRRRLIALGVPTMVGAMLWLIGIGLLFVFGTGGSMAVLAMAVTTYLPGVLILSLLVALMGFGSHRLFSFLVGR